MTRTRKRREERDARDPQFASLADRRARINRALRREEETPSEPFEEEDFTELEDGYPDAELGGEG